jgi:hypothetical protein
MSQAQGTAKDYLNWCVDRAMVYADMGDMTQAWASFTSDVRKHPDTEHIGYHSLLAMAMVSGLYNEPRKFREFVSGWNV